MCVFVSVWIGWEFVGVVVGGVVIGKNYSLEILFSSVHILWEGVQRLEWEEEQQQTPVCFPARATTSSRFLSASSAKRRVS